MKTAPETSLESTTTNVMSTIKIQVMEPSHLEGVRKFVNIHWPGSWTELYDLFERSELNGIRNAHVVLQNDEIVGYRLGLAPGKWTPELISCPITPEKYLHDWKTYSYAHSVLIDTKLQNKGLFKKLFTLAKEVAFKQGSNGFVGHAWISTSGEGRNLKALQALGWKRIASHKDIWRSWTECKDCGFGNHCACLSVEVVYEFDEHEKKNTSKL